MPHDKTKKQTLYSIVIPAYNESQRIAATLDKVLAYVGDQGWNTEIIVVDDGSRDDTPVIVRHYSERHQSVRLLQNPGNRGKGYSVRHGMLKASGDFLLFTDADLSSPIYEAAKLFAALEKGAEVVIGSRWLCSKLQIARQPFYRQFFGRVFNLYLRLVLGLQFKDTQCGFKAFTAHTAKDLFSRQKVERWGFDPELLFLARRMGFPVREIAIEWAHDDRSKINYRRDGLQMGVEVLKIRWYAASGQYASFLPTPADGQIPGNVDREGAMAAHPSLPCVTGETTDPLASALPAPQSMPHCRNLPGERRG